MEILKIIQLEVIQDLDQVQYLEAAQEPLGSLGQRVTTGVVEQ